jgi:CheY-like chemotaxis protein
MVRDVLRLSNLRRMVSRVPDKILIVDDAESWLEAAVQLLRRRGYDVRGVRTFQEGRDALETFEPDLLITDVRLNEFNGLYLFLRSHQRHPNMACLVVSGYPDPVLRREAIQQGAFDFLLKPVEPSVLYSRVADALASRGKRRWPRKAVAAGVLAEVEGQPAHLLDVSYGGVRLQLPFVASVGLPLEIRIPSFGRTVTANAVWVNHGGQQCGAALRMDEQIAMAWRAMVDRLPAIAEGTA